jgi:hypothetical protein
LEESDLISIRNTKTAESIPSKLTEFSQGNNELDASCSNIDGLFGEIHVFLQLHRICLFGGNRHYLHLETPK